MHHTPDGVAIRHPEHGILSDTFVDCTGQRARARCWELGVENGDGETQEEMEAHGCELIQVKLVECEPSVIGG